MLTLKLFESQINVIKRCYFNPKKKKKKPNHHHQEQKAQNKTNT